MRGQHVRGVEGAGGNKFLLPASSFRARKGLMETRGRECVVALKILDAYRWIWLEFGFDLVAFEFIDYELPVLSSMLM